MNYWEKSIFPSLNSKLDFKRFWLGALHDGIVITNESANTHAQVSKYMLWNYMNSSSIKSDGYTIVIKENYNIADGRFAHNGWLQELPHPVSKITWDNYAAVSEKTCKDLGVKDNDMISIKLMVEN